MSAFNVGDRVRVIKSAYKGKTAQVITPNETTRRTPTEVLVLTDAGGRLWFEPDELINLSRTFTVVVSGKTYNACLDPRATQVPGEIGLPEPKVRRKGKGYQYVYDLTDEQAVDVFEHFNVMQECFDLPGDPYSQAEARAIRKDMDRLAAVMARG